MRFLLHLALHPFDLLDSRRNFLCQLYLHRWVSMKAWWLCDDVVDRLYLLLFLDWKNRIFFMLLGLNKRLLLWLYVISEYWCLIVADVRLEWVELIMRVGFWCKCKIYSVVAVQGMWWLFVVYFLVLALVFWGEAFWGCDGQFVQVFRMPNLCSLADIVVESGDDFVFERVADYVMWSSCYHWGSCSWMDECLIVWYAWLMIW